MEGEHIIKIKSDVFVKNGKTEFHAHNKFLDSMYKHLANFLANTNNGIAGTLYNMLSNNTDSTNPIRIGTDTDTNTTASMTSLVSDLNIAPSNKSVDVENPETGTWKITYTATWNAGTIPNGTTIGEIGIRALRLLTSPINSSYSSNILITRLSSKDGDFTAFQVDATVPLTISYVITFQYS